MTWVHIISVFSPDDFCRLGPHWDWPTPDFICPQFWWLAPYNWRLFQRTIFQLYDADHISRSTSKQCLGVDIPVPSILPSTYFMQMHWSTGQSLSHYFWYRSWRVLVTPVQGLHTSVSCNLQLSNFSASDRSAVGDESTLHCISQRLFEQEGIK